MEEGTCLSLWHGRVESSGRGIVWIAQHCWWGAMVMRAWWEGGMHASELGMKRGDLQ
jgi:hypothetical protein